MVHRDHLERRGPWLLADVVVVSGCAQEPKDFVHGQTVVNMSGQKLTARRLESTDSWLGELSQAEIDDEIDRFRVGLVSLKGYLQGIVGLWQIGDSYFLVLRQWFQRVGGVSRDSRGSLTSFNNRETLKMPALS